MDEMLGDAGYIDVTKNCDTDEIDGLKLLIARRAYDLACHTVAYLDDDVVWRKGKGHTSCQIVEEDVPDMTQFPYRGADGSK